MTKPRFIQIIAIVNSLLVIYMLYTVYQLKRPSSVPEPIHVSQKEQAPLPSPEELLTQLESTSTASEALMILQQLTVLDAPEAEHLHRWLGNQVLDNPTFDRLDRLNLANIVNHKLIDSSYDAATLAEEFLTQLQDTALWLPERNQALILLYLLYAENPPRNENISAESVGSNSPEVASPDGNVLSTALISAMDIAQSSGDSSLAATCLDGSLYLFNNGLPNPGQSIANEIALAALSENYQSTTQLNAIKYAQATNLDILTQAAKLLRESDNVSVAVAAKRYLQYKAESAQ